MSGATHCPYKKAQGPGKVKIILIIRNLGLFFQIDYFVPDTSASTSTAPV